MYRIILVTLALSATAASAQDLSLQQKIALKQACGPDIRRLCGSVTPGGGKIISCMQEHRKEVSQSCTRTLAEIFPAAKN